MNSRQLCATIAVVTLLAACQSTPAPVPTPAPTIELEPTATPVEKGQIFRLYASLDTGSYAAMSESVDNAINLALDQQTDSGVLCDGVLKVDYVKIDNNDAISGTWTMQKVQANALKINADVDAMAVIGPLDSGAARIAMPILNRTGIALLSPSADYVGLTKPYSPNDPDVYFEMGKRNFMRLAPPRDAQGAAAAKWAGTLGLKNAFIVSDGEEYGRGPADTFIGAAGKHGIVIAGSETVSDKIDNLPFIASRILITKADLIYYSGSDSLKALALMKELRAEKIKVKVMGTSTLLAKNFAFPDSDLVNGVMATSFGIAMDKLSPKGAQFVRAYQSKYSSMPDTYAFTGYEAASVVLTAARNVCQKDRVALLNAMFNTLDFDGVMGKWSFDDNGDISATTFNGNTFDNGTLVVTTTLTLE
ncbi:MAG TPA: branched-chain amino acid ABC transporter substrate-binding protein [Anaerolineae bacterium]|jgi:branched-chain amino acid transport system substrate-binding protein